MGGTGTVKWCSDDKGFGFVTPDELVVTAERERDPASSVSDRAAREAERRLLRERAAELDTQLSIRRHEHVRAALEHPGPHPLVALGPPPDQPSARHTWQQAGQRLEAFRFDHGVTDTRDAHGAPPATTNARRDWQHARHELQRDQRAFGASAHHVGLSTPERRRAARRDLHAG